MIRALITRCGLALCLFYLVGCAVNPATGKRNLNLVPVSTQQEIELGKEAYGMAIQQMGGAYPDELLEAYVSDVGARLAQVSHRPDLDFRFRVINDSTPNAFALPGGFVAINRGLLTALSNEAQLAAVLGHEVGHVTARHGVQGMQRGALFGAALSVLSAATEQSAYSSLAQQAGQMAAGLIDKSYSREQERESDQLGIDYMVKAKYDPTGAIQLQEYFYRQLEGGQQASWVTGIFRSHPFSVERLENNRRDIAGRFGYAVGSPPYRLGQDEFSQAMSGLRQAEAGFRLFDEAMALKGKEDTRRKIALLLRAATEAPDQSLILTHLGLTYLDANDPESARRHLSAAVRLDGNYFLSRFGLGYLQLEAGEFEASATQLELSRKLLPTLVASYHLGQCWEQTGRSSEAVRLYKGIVEQDAAGELGKKAAARLKAMGAR